MTVRYEVDERGIQRPVEIERVLISTQHRDGLDAESLIKPDLLEHVVEPILDADYADLYDPARLRAKDFLYVNPTGKFVIGGPMGDTGLTGRKIIVDTYGGAAPHGGGAFSGKDPTKVDRSAAYAARYVAKNVVAAGLAGRCQVQVAYAIGVAHPMSVLVDTFGTEAQGLSNERISELVREHFDLRPGAIVRDLDLFRPIYRKTAAYGHFGRTDSADYTWERTDKADALRAAAGLSAPADRLAGREASEPAGADARRRACGGGSPAVVAVALPVTTPAARRASRRIFALAVSLDGDRHLRADSGPSIAARRSSEEATGRRRSRRSRRRPGYRRSPLGFRR